MDVLLGYWSGDKLVANGLILLHLLGALAVGLLVGYERSYHGRAAGMRTYALVCVGATALTVISGFPGQWFGGLPEQTAIADPGRAIQGIMTGVGFLGAGVIMKEGFTIRGLSTAASIWITAAIGITIGVGFYGAAIATALISLLVMSGMRTLERRLPHQTVMHLSVRYARQGAPQIEEVRSAMRRLGFEVIDWAYQLAAGGSHVEFNLALQANGSGDTVELVSELSQKVHVLEFRLSPTRV